MAAAKGHRLGTAVGFLAGLLFCLNAVKDAMILWPPNALWGALNHPHRLQFGGGIALIIVSLVLSLRRPATEP